MQSTRSDANTPASCTLSDPRLGEHVHTGHNLQLPILQKTWPQEPQGGGNLTVEDEGAVI